MDRERGQAGNAHQDTESRGHGAAQYKGQSCVNAVTASIAIAIATSASDRLNWSSR